MRDEVYGLMPDHVEYPEYGEKGFQYKTVTNKGGMSKEDAQKFIELCWADLTPKPTQVDLRTKKIKFCDFTPEEFEALNKPMSMEDFRKIRPEKDERERLDYRVVNESQLRNTPAPAARALTKVEPGADVKLVVSEEEGGKVLVEVEEWDKRVEANRTVIGWINKSDVCEVGAAPSFFEGDDSEDDTARE